MPHDKNNCIVNVGDEVIVRATVTEVHASEEYCNMTLKVKDGNGVGKETCIVMNTHGAEVVKEAPSPLLSEKKNLAKKA